jgi:hypothetical protein
MHARLDRGSVRLLTRTGLDWAHKYPAIAEAVSSMSARQAYLDGELCGVGPDGITSPADRRHGRGDRFDQAAYLGESGHLDLSHAEAGSVRLLEHGA